MRSVHSAVRVRRFATAAVLALLAQSVMVAAAAPPPDRQLVRLLPLEGHFVTGSRLAPQHEIWILFMKAPCTLAIDGADRMWRAWSVTYAGGCWHPTGTTDNGFVYIDGQGASHAIDMTPFAMPRARLMPDGTATITEPDYDSLTFMARVKNERIRAALDRLHRQQQP